MNGQLEEEEKERFSQSLSRPIIITDMNDKIITVYGNEN